MFGQAEEQELVLTVLFDEWGYDTFEVLRNLRSPLQDGTDSIITLDYDYVPWPRYNGNLLW